MSEVAWFLEYIEKVGDIESDVLPRTNSFKFQERESTMEALISRVVVGSEVFQDRN